MAINNNHTRVKRVVSPISNEVQQNDISSVIPFSASIGDRQIRTTLPSFAYETGSKEMKELSDWKKEKKSFKHEVALILNEEEEMCTVAKDGSNKRGKDVFQ
ncbi:hypothetical protein CEXT_583601 [Caerostris extrusa]|uniref:Uncharacterized protein n=1 Tax=Caerostris extrusa TaxID=172846 RepID=A0AAV4XNB8_CAEEX|nr:hypothetical protein CEXT_583601 [Caerostris extrusa]